MKAVKHVLDQIHRRSLWQVLGVYLAGGRAVLQVVQTLVLLGLSLVLLTAFVRKGVENREALSRAGLAALFTWRNAAVSGVGAFALRELVVTGWLLIGGRERDSRTAPSRSRTRSSSSQRSKPGASSTYKRVRRSPPHRSITAAASPRSSPSAKATASDQR